MSFSYSPSIIKDGLVLYLDAANQKSYPGPRNLLDGLVSYWKLDGNSNDSVGGNNGTDTNVSYVVGKLEQGASFNGTSSYITTSATININKGSVSFWFYPTFNPSNNTDQRIFVASDSFYCEYNAIGSTLTFYEESNLGFPLIFSLAPDSGFVFITFTWDSTTINLYKNGTLTSSRAAYGVNPSIHTILIGGRPSTPYQRSCGIADEVGIWNRALNEKEVSHLYNSTSGLGYPFLKWNDLSKNQNDVSLINNPVHNSANGGSFYFDGIDDYITLTPITNNVYTVCFWTKMVGNDGGYGYFGSDQITNPYPNTRGFAISEGGGQQGLVYGDLYYGVISGVIKIGHINDGWNHVCFVINTLTSYITTYINGQLDNNYSVPSGLSTTVDTIGFWSQNIGTLYNILYGHIGVYQIYNRALSQEEVSRNYNATKGRFGK